MDASNGLLYILTDVQEDTLRLVTVLEVGRMELPNHLLHWKDHTSPYIAHRYPSRPRPNTSCMRKYRESCPWAIFANDVEHTSIVCTLDLLSALQRMRTEIRYYMFSPNRKPYLRSLNRPNVRNF